MRKVKQISGERLKSNSSANNMNSEFQNGDTEIKSGRYALLKNKYERKVKMFVRWKPKKLIANGSKKWGCTSYKAYLVESFRVDGKAKQKTIAYLGSFRYRNGFNGSRGYFEREETFLHRAKDEIEMFGSNENVKKILVGKILEYIKNVAHCEGGLKITQHIPKEEEDGE